MKITLTNCFEILKPEIPHLTSSEEYGKWFADHTHNWSAKEIARFNAIHVEQIINCHDNVSQIANGHKIQKAIREAGVFDPNTAGKSGRYHDNWNGKLQDMIRAYNQWDDFERQDNTYMHMEFERKKFFDGFFSHIKNNGLSAQHLWLFNVAGVLPKANTVFDGVNTSNFDVVVAYPWSHDGKTRALKNILDRIWNTDDIDLLSHLVEKKWDRIQNIGTVLFNQKVGRQDNKTQFISDAMDLGVNAPVDIIPGLLQSNHNSKDIILKILYAAPETTRHNMVKVVLPNVVEKDPAFTMHLLSDQRLTPNCSATLVSFVGSPMLFPLFKCVDDEHKDEMLAQLCTGYIKKNTDASLKKVSDFIHKISECFPSSEQKMVVLRMFALLVEAKNPQVGLVLSSMVLERAASEPDLKAVTKRKM